MVEQRFEPGKFKFQFTAQSQPLYYISSLIAGPEGKNGIIYVKLYSCTARTHWNPKVYKTEGNLPKTVPSEKEISELMQFTANQKVIWLHFKL